VTTPSARPMKPREKPQSFEEGSLMASVKGSAAPGTIFTSKTGF